MRFAEPLALIALVLAPLAILAYFLIERRFERKLSAAGDRDLLSEMAGLGADGGRGARLVRAILLAAGLALIAVALARPQFGMRTEVRKGRAMDLVIALDLSKSMLARDVVPSRLERVRAELADLIGRMKGDRIGFVAFTSAAVPLCPLTVDHDALLLQLRSAQPGDLPRGGTAIAEGIEQAQRMFESAKESSGGRAILVVTDGEENEGDPEKAAKAAKEAGIEVHVAGVGSRTGEPIPIMDQGGQQGGYLKDASGQTVVSRLNEQMIKSVAAAGGGIAALPTGSGGIDLEPIRSHLGRLKKAEMAERTVRIYEERYRWALVPAFACLFLATLVRPSRRRLARLRVAGALLVLGVVLAPSTGRAGPLERPDPDVKEGNALLREGKGKEALTSYDKAKSRHGDRSPILALDRGLAQAAAGELDAAVKELETAYESSNDPSVRAQAAFAMGNARRTLGKFDEAIKDYRRALVEDPKHTGARKNLELAAAMKRIQALQPKQNKPDEDKDKKDDKQDRPDAGPQDAAGTDGPQDQADGGTSPDGGSNQDQQQDGGSGKSDGSQSADESPDAASPQDGGAQPKPEEEQKDQKAAEKDQESADQILDALKADEKALQKKRMLQKMKGKPVAKDW